MLSCSAPPCAGMRACGRGRTTRTPRTSVRYEAALIPNAAGMPRASTVTAASAGPAARARFHVIELSATAAAICSLWTSDASRASAAGDANAFATPRQNASTITTAGDASPAQELRGERLEPQPGRGERVAEEVRPEPAAEDQLDRSPRPSAPRLHVSIFPQLC
jgi:hypothetical protein